MLRIKGIFQNSKIARRIFFLFFVSALLPIATLAFFSLRQVDSLIANNVESSLRQSAKGYGLSVHERLILLDEKLASYATALNQPPPKTSNQKLDGFNQLHLFGLNDVQYQTKNNIPLIVKSERLALQAGRPVMLVKHNVDQSAKLYLLRTVQKLGLIIAGELSDESVWGRPETYDFNQEFCVYGKTNLLLFCPHPQLASQLQPIKFKWAEKTTGTTEWRNEHKDVFIGFWRLFLKPNFHYHGLTIVVASDQKMALEGVSGLRNIFIIISLFTLVIIAFFSTFQIRRYLIPVEKLMAGIRRIANNNFKQPVNVETNDEFQQLADSFNLMSSKVSKQFEFLATLSEIDRLILSNRAIKEILLSITTQANKALKSNMISFAKLDEEDKSSLQLYSEDTNHIHGMSVTSHDISLEEINAFSNIETVIFSASDEKKPGYLASLVEEQISYFVLAPIFSVNQLSAVLIFGFPPSDLTQETRSWLRELGDRFSIALEKSAWENKLYQQAHYDPLTHLPNRQLLNDRLEQSIKKATRDNTVFSLMFMDLDRFKTINDSLGHSSGDKLLKAVSQRFTNTLRDDDTVARLGGDEFIMLLSPPKTAEALFSHTSLIAKKILSSLNQPFSIDGHEVYASASIGVASFPNDGQSLEALIKNADAAMYHAKSEGGNNFQFYSNELSAKAEQQFKMESNLHKALEHNEFELFFQPQIDAKTCHIVGAEALIRWNHPTEGMILPDDFIPLTEETGLIMQMGTWALEEACRQNKEWQDANLPKISVSVNLSPKQFKQKDLITIVESALTKTKLAPAYLDIEILEGTAMDDIEQTIETLKRFKDLGVSISIDDYGTGHSTLSYIKKFPVDNLKIDRTFIHNLMDDEGDQAIVASTITLANKLGLKVLAEGVEDERQLAWLQDAGCDEIQGYHFSRPIPASEFVKLLAKETA